MCGYNGVQYKFMSWTGPVLLRLIVGQTIAVAAVEAKSPPLLSWGQPEYQYHAIVHKSCHRSNNYWDFGEF